MLGPLTLGGDTQGHTHPILPISSEMGKMGWGNSSTWEKAHVEVKFDKIDKIYKIVNIDKIFFFQGQSKAI